MFNLFCRKGDLRGVNVLCLRDRSRDGTRDISHSLLLSLNVPDIKNVPGKISLATFTCCTNDKVVKILLWILIENYQHQLYTEYFQWILYTELFLETFCFVSFVECPKCVGWEKNEKQKLAPRFVNLSASMDPTRYSS